MVSIYSHFPAPKSYHHFNRYCKFIDHYLQLRQKPEKFKGTFHHILPESMFPQFLKEKWNLVWLTHKQHYIAHHILWKALRNRSMCYAFWLMNHDKKSKKKITSTEFDILNFEQASHSSILNSGKNNYNYKRIFTIEERLKISFAAKGRIVTEEAKRNMSINNALKGKFGREHHTFGTIQSKCACLLCKQVIAAGKLNQHFDGPGCIRNRTPKKQPFKWIKYSCVLCRTELSINGFNQHNGSNFCFSKNSYLK